MFATLTDYHMERASEFCRMSSTWGALQQNLCQGCWAVIRLKTAFLSALSSRNRPKISLTLSPTSLLVTNFGCLVTTLRLSSSRLSGRLWIHRDRRKHDKFGAMSNPCWLFFFYIEGIVHKQFVPTGQTVNEKLYCDVLRRVRKNNRCKRPDKWRINSWVLHHDKTTVHASLFVRLFLASANTKIIPTLPTHRTPPPVISSYSRRWNWSSRATFWQH